MADQTIPFRSVKSGSTEVIDSFRAEVERLVEGFNFREMGQKLEDFGREKPVVLALVALTVGVAAGILVRNTTSSESTATE